MKKYTFFALLFIFSLFITGCGISTQKEIRIGATSGPHAEIAEIVAKEANKQGLNVKVVEFSDYITPNLALSDGEVELAAYQHEPFLNNFNENKGTDLTSIGKTIIMPMGIYSNKIHNMIDISNGATVSIPNDPTNAGRALMLLEKAGLIKLKNGLEFKSTVKDIIDNPKNLKFQELEAAQLPRSLEDVDIAVITMNYVMSAGLNVEKQGIFFEDKNEPLAVVILATRKEDKDNPDYKKILDIYHSDVVKTFINEHFKGTITSAD